MKQALGALVLLALVGLAGVIGYQRWLGREPAAPAGSLRLFGNVELRDAALAFQEPERIEALHVEEGEAVAAGQLLATLRGERIAAEVSAQQARIAAQAAEVERLERGPRPQEIERARAERAAAEARMARARRAIGRLEATAPSGASSARELDDAHSSLAIEEAQREVRAQSLALVLEGPRVEEIAAARARLDALRAELRLLEVRRGDLELRAPAPGIVQSRLLEVGELAAPGRPAFVLALTDPKWVRAWLPEPELGRVEPGRRAHVLSDSFGGRSYEGWIGFISPVAEFTPRTIETPELRTQLVYELRVFVDDPENELRLGMPVTVDVDLEPRERQR